MNKLFSTICAATVAIGTSLSTAAPVSAAPIAVKPAGASSSDVIQVQERWHRRGFYRDRDRAWYNGHRGYREHRRGYRRHGDFWFPAGAFVAGALIGGALASPDPYYRPAPRRVYRSYGSAHVEWCYNRYRSYRAGDNTFQPYNGPRQQCYSPYR